jgi:hypothetical protein
MIYELHYVGGPLDGQTALSPLPYDTIASEDWVYRADECGEDCLEWKDDETRIIRLRYRGVGELEDFFKGLL